MSKLKKKLPHDKQIILIAQIIREKGTLSFVDVVKEMEKRKGPKSTVGLKSNGTLYRRMRYLLNTDIAMKNNIQVINKGRMLFIRLIVPKGLTSIPGNSLTEDPIPEKEEMKDRPYSIIVDNKEFRFPSVNECGCDGTLLRSAAFKAIAAFLDALSQ